MLLKGKVALITGASTGIGKAIAQRFIKEGAHVIVFGRNKPDYKTEFCKVDVSKESDIREAMKKIKRLDVLINNAGVFFMESIEASTKKFDTTMDINLKGAYWTCKYSIPLLKKSKGNVVNISSIIGIIPAPDVAAYCISKAGVIMLTKLFAQEYASVGIRANAILPGPIDTPMLRSSVSSPEEMHEVYAKNNPMRRIGKPEEIAAAAAFLASDEASYINGALLPVDGGELAAGGGY
jgi:NAD(P)-dependent dehydrogenase (short-subunit alcohol dehydrogenase family)